MNEMLHMILTGGLSVCTFFFVIWLIHLPLKNAAIVDVGWGLGFILLCGIYISLGEGWNLRNSLLFIIVALWGLRITFYLLKRLSAERQEDKRYQKFRNQWKGNVAFNFLLIFEFQALLEIVIGIPFILVAINPDPGIDFAEIAGVIIFIASLFGETIADEQLYSFKRDPANKGKTCNVGLWAYSRHPNYFFEWLIWVGIFIFALGSPRGWISFVSPALMYYLVMYVSGVPLAEEQSLMSRGDEYREYQKQTSIFFPMPRRLP